MHAHESKCEHMRTYKCLSICTNVPLYVVNVCTFCMPSHSIGLLSTVSPASNVITAQLRPETMTREEWSQPRATLRRRHEKQFLLAASCCRSSHSSSLLFGEDLRQICL